MKGFVNSKDFFNRLPADEQQAITEKATQLKQAYQLAQLRQQADISQKQLAEKMGVSQANISKVENGKDIQLSTLQRYISALGGKVSITAQMPSGEVVIMAWIT